MRLVPVDQDPFAQPRAPRLVPVEGDPFAQPAAPAPAAPPTATAAPPAAPAVQQPAPQPPAIPTQAPRTELDFHEFAVPEDFAAQPVAIPAPAGQPAVREDTFTEGDPQVGRLRTAGSQFVRGAAGVATAIPKAAAIASTTRRQPILDAFDAIDRGERVDPDAVPFTSIATLARYKVADAVKRAELRGVYEDLPDDPRGTPLYQAGEQAQAAVEGAFPVNREYADEFIAGKVPQGLGSAAGFLGLGVAGRAAGAGALTTAGAGGAALEGTDQFESALQAGASLEDAFSAAKWGATVGLSEGLPITRLLDRLDAGTGGSVRRLITSTLKQGTEEAAQEAFQTIMGNLIASDLVGYDPDQGLFTGSGEAAGVGFTVGGLMNFIGQMIVGRRAPRGGAAPQDQPVPAEPAASEAATDVPDVLETVPETEATTDLRAELETVLQDERPLDEQLAEREQQAQAEAEQAQAAQEAEIEAAGLQPAGTRVTADFGDGQPLTGTVIDTYIQDIDGQDVPTVTVQMDDGTAVDIAAGEAQLRAVEGEGTRAAPVKVETGAELDAVAPPAEPTPAQAEAGNYSKTHAKWKGLDVAIETGKGQERTGTGPDGTPWTVTMPSAYGYVKRTNGADGEQVDVYLGNQDSGKVWVVDQIDPATGNFDEHKSLMGFASEEDAAGTYLLGFSDQSGPARLGAMTEMSVAQFKQWLKNGNTRKALRYVKPAQAAPETPATVVAMPTQADQVRNAAKRLGTDDAMADDLALATDSQRVLRALGTEGARLMYFGEGAKPNEIVTIVEPADGSQVLVRRADGNSQYVNTARLWVPPQGAAPAAPKTEPLPSTGAPLPGSGSEAAPEPQAPVPRGVIDALEMLRDGTTDALKSVTVPDLKAAAKLLGLPVGGSKGQLMQRLKKAARVAREAAAPVAQVPAEADTQPRAAAAEGTATVRRQADTEASRDPAVERVREAIQTGGARTAVTLGAPVLRRAAKALGIEVRQGMTATDVARLLAEHPDMAMEAVAPKTEPAKKAQPAAKPPASDSGRLEDFGEVLEGARKHYAAAYRDQMGAAGNLATETLANAWPEPDYQRLLDDGADPWVVGFIHAARDEVPAKPRSSWKLKGWVAKAELLRDFSRDLLDGTVSKDRVLEALSDPKFAQLQAALQGRIDLYRAAGHAKSLKGVRLSQGRYGVWKGEKQDPPLVRWTVERKAKATAFSNMPMELASGATREEAIANFVAAYDRIETQPRASKQVKFSIYSYRGGDKAGGFWIGKKVGKGYIDLKKFDTAAEARAYRNDNHDALIAQLERRKSIPDHRKESDAPRVGQDHRDGADVTAEQFSETFGFRGVQFGNYVEGPRRQQDVNRAYDALMDLAGVLDLPPKALSLNGELGLAFGARGKGGKGSPKAHYERDTVVINLTKREGAGSLAHELWHAMDNYFARRRGEPGGYVTEAPTARGEGVRPEMVKAFADVVRAINQTSLAQRSGNLDKRRTKAYWSTGREMTARAFESYIVAKLQDQGAANDYLANIVSEDYWNAAEALGIGEGTEGEPSYPYLTAAEIPRVRAAFDAFFGAVETRETDRGVAMFSRSQIGHTESGTGIHVEEITDEEAQQFFQQLRDAGRAGQQVAHRTLGGGQADESWRTATRIAGQGGPETVYRASQNGLSARNFKESSFGFATGHPSASLGVWFTNNPSDAVRYGPVVEAFHLDIRNPKVYTTDQVPQFGSPAHAKALRTRLQAQGHDGIVFDYRDVDGPVHVIAFESERVIVPAVPSAAVFQRHRDETMSAVRDALEDDADPNGLVQMGPTPDVLLAVGIDQLPLVISNSAIEKAHFDHGISIRLLGSLPELIGDPAAVFESETKDGAFVVMTDELHRGSPVLVAIHPKREVGRAEVNFIPTVYSKDHPEAIDRWIRDGKTRYWSQRKTRALSTKGRVQFPPMVHSKPGSKQSVLTESDVVKGRFRRGTDTASAMPLAEVKATAKRVADAQRLGLPIEVYATEADLPAEIRAQARKEGATGQIKAVFWDGAVHLVADRMGSAREVEEAILHEASGHFGAIKLFGPQFKEAFTTLYRALGRAPGIRRLATQHGIDMLPYFETAKGLTEDQRALYLSNEFLAHLQQQKAGRTLPQKVRDAILEFVGLVRDQLRRMGLVELAKVSDADLAFLLARMQLAARGGGRVQRATPQFARAPKADSPEAMFSREVKNDFAEENRRLREEDRSLWDRAKQELKRQLFPGGLLPPDVFDEKISRDSEFEVIEFDVRHLVGRLENVLKKDHGATYKNLDEATQKLVTEGLHGRIRIGLSTDTKVTLIAMRQYIDRLSRDYMQILQRQVAELAAQGKDEAAQARADLLETIAGNVGQYVHRSYRAFDDPRWFKDIPDDVANAARTYLINRYKEEGVESPAEQRRLADVTINEIVKNGTAYDSMEGFIKESKLGAKDLSVLKRRKEIAPEVRALMGEYTDPRVNFAKTATKMGRLVWNQKFLDKVLELGKGSFLFEGKNRPPRATVQIAADASEVYAPLNGLWTFPEIDQAFRDALGKEQMGQVYRTMVQINGMVKFGKTVLSPTTAMRNWQSAMFFSLANGHFNLLHMSKSLSGLREYFTQQGSGKRLEYLRRLKHLGVVYDTPYAGEMMRLLDESKIQDVMFSGKARSTFQESMRLAQKFYQFGDDFWKIIGFENEKRLLMKHAGMDEAAAEKEAAERIRNTYPTYSLVGRFVNTLRRFPLAGTFVSFPAEIIRTTGNMIRYAYKDMKTPGMRPIAMRRMMGLALVGGFAHALQAISMSWMGMDDDEEEAVRLLAAPWQKNSNLVFIGRDEKGSLRYIDLSFLDPYNYWKRPITGLLRDQPWDEKMMQIVKDAYEPFFGTDITAGALFEIAANKKENGGPVRNDQAPPLDQLTDSVDHLWKTVQPGIFSNIGRTLKAIEGQTSRSGRKYTLKDEMPAWVGWRVSTLDPKTAIYYRSYEFKDVKRAATKELNRALYDANEVSDAELRSAYETAMKMRERGYRDMRRLIKAAKSSGMTEAQVRQVLRGASVPAVDVGHLLRGSMPRWMPTMASLRSAQRRGGVLFEKEVNDRFRERYGKVRGFVIEDDQAPE